MRIILRRIVAGALFLGAIAALGSIPVKDNLLPAVDTYGEESFLVQLLLLCVVCVVGGFIVLPQGLRRSLPDLETDPAPRNRIGHQANVDRDSDPEIELGER